MEFLTGVKEKETIGISEILSGDYVGKVVKMNGAVHNIRDMGEFAFVILRKAEGLVQCVYEERKTDFDTKRTEGRIRCGSDRCGYFGGACPAGI